MRAALSGLTTRGRCFIAAGITSTLSALGLGERDLLRVGVLLIALPLVAAAVVARTRYLLECERRLLPARVEAGRPSQVQLRITNVSRIPTGVLLVEDTLPYVLGGRPRFVLDRVEPRGTREVSYAVRSDLRGRYAVGPLAVRIADPFGLVELTRAFAAVDHLTVTPVITALPHVRLGGDWTGGGDSRPRSVAAAGEDDVAPREYRVGDDLRRVHWRSTARYGELMVRREEQPWQSRGTLLLDTRMRAHRGEGAGSSFEWAVSAAASLGVHLCRSGFNLTYLSDSQEPISGYGGVSDVGGGSFEGLLLDGLATVRTSGRNDLDAAIAHLRRSVGNGGLVVAVLGALSAADAQALGRIRQGGATAVAVILDTAAWSGVAPRAQTAAHSEDDAAAHLLQRAGWRVLRAGPRAPLASVWPEAAVPASATVAT
ncbi:MAG: hypothetical protein QOK42_2093 [Frankiaceae bacterium]|nr:hypothetical protein [Frankiaceae bacterium]MDX6225958.1 hypothetical protein [Frankiales bacterium]MDX6274551.1 hypothetical protein [Frankiales bacterium]